MSVPDPVTWPPGVTADGIVDPSALASAHTVALDNRSYTLVSNRTVRINGTVASRTNLSLRLAANRTHHVFLRLAGPRAPRFLGEPPVSAEFWSDGETYLRKYTADNTTTYNQFTPPDRFVGRWQFWQSTVAFNGRASYTVFLDTFTHIPTQVVGREEGNRVTRIRLAGNKTVSEQLATVGDGPARNLTLAATVLDSGLVSRFDLSYRTQVDGRPAVVTWHIEYRDIDRTAVSRPSWFDRAFNESFASS